MVATWLLMPLIMASGVLATAVVMEIVRRSMFALARWRQDVVRDVLLALAAVQFAIAGAWLVDLSMNHERYRSTTVLLLLVIGGAVTALLIGLAREKRRPDLSLPEASTPPGLSDGSQRRL
jgi:hypothetical protein